MIICEQLLSKYIPALYGHKNGSETFEQLKNRAERGIQEVVDAYLSDWAIDRDHIDTKDLVKVLKNLAQIRSELPRHPDAKDRASIELIADLEQFYLFCAVEIELRKRGQTMKLSARVYDEATDTFLDNGRENQIDVLRAADFIRGQLDLKYDSELKSLEAALKEYFELGFFPSVPPEYHNGQLIAFP